jgi:AcrR family transcriptional regulator
MLFVRSAEDLTARARIRDAAMARFGAEGFDGVTLRAIASDAGVSPALVVHHFGSKEGLRKACDEHLMARIRQGAADAAAQGGSSGMGAMRGLVMSSEHERRYLARALLDVTPDASELYDQVLEATERFLAEGEAAGSIRPSRDPRTRAALFLTFQLAGLVLAPHLARALGVDDVFELETTFRIGRTTAEMYTGGVFADDRYVRLYEQASDPQGVTT